MILLTELLSLDFLISFLIIILVFYWSYRQNALDLTGSVFATVFGLIIWHTQGFSFFLIILSFFIISYAGTQVKSSMKKDINNEQSTRSIDNVVSNGLIPFFSALFGFNFIFFGSISSALADTLASELGVLSKRKPFMITDFREVLPGKDGAISTVGLLVSGLAGVIIAFLVAFTGSSEVHVLFLVIILSISGFLGSLFDSFLGATLERRGDLSNGSVNFISTLFGGLVAFLFKVLLVG